MHSGTCLVCLAVTSWLVRRMYVWTDSPLDRMTPCPRKRTGFNVSRVRGFHSSHYTQHQIARATTPHLNPIAPVQKVNEAPEERLARLEKETSEAHEKATLAMEANRTALQERQKREQQSSKFNSMKIHNQWRKIMRMATVDQLRENIEVLSQSHEREVDRKDAIIQMFDRDIEDAEDQFEMAVRGNMQARNPAHSRPHFCQLSQPILGAATRTFAGSCRLCSSCWTCSPSG
jgi:hypothetical protein